MKKVIFITLLSAACNAHNNQALLNTTGTVSPNYNIQKTNKLFDALSQNPKVEVIELDISNEVWYIFYYQNVKYTVTHTLQIPYGQKESWDINADSLDGSDILVSPRSLSEIHRVSPESFNSAVSYVLNSQKNK